MVYRNKPQFLNIFSILDQKTHRIDHILYDIPNIQSQIIFRSNMVHIWTTYLDSRFRIIAVIVEIRAIISVSQFHKLRKA